MTLSEYASKINEYLRDNPESESLQVFNGMWDHFEDCMTLYEPMMPKLFSAKTDDETGEIYAIGKNHDELVDTDVAIILLS
ncbi:hypothetical protein N9137_00760 [Pseudomonadales bacterium]|nr:hypothetical protein [Pseudomonadales bacterium]